jgi:hypothetical protein
MLEWTRDGGGGSVYAGKIFATGIEMRLEYHDRKTIRY